MDDPDQKDGMSDRPRARWPMSQRREVPLIQLLPNLMTIGALCAGLMAIRLGAAGRFPEAVALILVAAVLDGLDGRVARFLKSESPMGAELDSLADFLNFGAAPGLLMSFWAFPGRPDIGLGAAVIYVVCCVLRLARFNVGNAAAAALSRQGRFQGVPSPAGALLSMLPLYLHYLWPTWPNLPEPAVAVWLVFVGVLMISPFGTPSLKSVRVPTEKASFAVVGGVAMIVLLLRYPWATLSTLSTAYLIVVVHAGVRSLLRRS
ncbi:CDP-alcohol phosphatidyltransferase family protein [Fuscibacter oryzae]|nr:phosphatidylcholine/phosphatidylserine synthase [Fuscibacter oryzae]